MATPEVEEKRLTLSLTERQSAVLGAAVGLCYAYMLLGTIQSRSGVTPEEVRALCVDVEKQMVEQYPERPGVAPILPDLLPAVDAVISLLNMERQG